MKIASVLVSYMKENHGALDIALKVLKKHSMQYKAAERDRVRSHHYKNKDLIIVIGGDGTFLRTAQCIKDDMPILGVNANPKEKEGFFMQTDKKNFEEHLEKVMKKQYHIKKLPRLAVSINQKNVGVPALNEFYIGHPHAYCMSHYYLTIDKHKEQQKSSGVLVGTAASSFAWLGAAGHRKRDLNDVNILYAVREPYFGTKLPSYKLVKGKLASAQKLEITAITPGIVVADSVSKEYHFDQGDVIAVRQSERPLHACFFSK